MPVSKSGSWFVSAVVALMGAGVGVGITPAQADSPRSPYTVARVGATSTYTATPASGPVLSGTLKNVVETAATRLTDEGGGTIRFGAGTYDLASTWWEFDNLLGVTFQGAGMGSTLITNNASASTDTEPFDMMGSDRVTIRDLTVRAGGPFRSTSDAIDFDGGDLVVIERVEVAGARGRGIVFDGKGGEPITHADDNIVRDCWVHHVPSDGIELLASSRNLVERCRVNDVGGHGIQITKASSVATQPNKPSVENVLRDNIVDESGQDGINVNSGNRNTFIGNRVTNSADVTSGRDGIRISSSDGRPCDMNVVRTNVATDTQAVKTQSRGLYISSAACVGTIVGSDNSFAGNRVEPIRNSGTGTVFEQGNQHPTVSAGADLSTSVGSGAALDGTVADDGPAPLRSAWSLLSGPQAVTFDNPANPDTMARFSQPGTYTLRLTATDGAGLSAADDTVVTVHAGGTSVLQIPIAVGSDDGEERSAGAVTRSSKNLELVTDGVPQVVGLRFTGVQVPRGATVTGAHVQFTASGATTVATNLDVRLQLSGNAAAISGNAFNLSSRLSASSAPVSWSPAPWPTVGAAGQDQRTPALTGALQQVVSRADWTNGNAVMVLFTGSGQRKAHAFDGNPANAAVLHVTYTLP